MLFCLIQRNGDAAIELGWSWAESVSGHAHELSSLDALSIPALFFAGACTWLAGAAFARGAGVAGSIGARTSTLLVLLCLVGLAFLIARGLAYPSLHGAMSHWFTIPGFVAGIPAVPWMAPGALGVLLLRRAGLSATAARG